MKLTIFVHSYNREKYLKRMYDLLAKQEKQDFVWLIDDNFRQGVLDKLDKVKLTALIETIKFAENAEVVS